MHCLLALLGIALLTQDADAWKSARIDTAAKESFRALRVDTLGRLFIGGRDGLFVCEPTERGYAAPRLLLRFPADSSLNDLEIRGNDLYVLTSTALYVVADGVRKREGLTPRKLLWGVPGGNVLRSMTWGPEGDLYIAFANPARPNRLAFWTFFSEADKSKTPYRGPGGVVRCNPDGTNVRIVALGLQNPAGLAFDPQWNLYTTDSGDGASAQLRHVAPGLPTLLNGIRPMLAQADDGLLNANADQVTRLAIEPNGAGVQAKRNPLIACKDAKVLTATASRIFALQANGALVVLTQKDQALKPYEAAEATAEKLWQELGDPSWQRRYRAHVEIVRRGGNLLKDANKRLLATKANDPALPYLVWLAAKSGQGSVHLFGCVEHADPRVRVQALRALAEFPDQLREASVFSKGLLDDNPQVLQAALAAFLAPKVAWGRPMLLTVERGPASSDDPLLRQTAALLLGQKATRKQLENLCASVDATRRLTAVIAIGHRLIPTGSLAPLPSHLPLADFKEESVYVIAYADGKVDLRERGRVGTFTIAEHWAADKHVDEVHLLFKVLQRMTKDEDAAVRRAAMELRARCLAATP